MIELVDSSGFFLGDVSPSSKGTSSYWVTSDFSHTYMGRYKTLTVTCLPGGSKFLRVRCCFVLFGCHLSQVTKE